MKPSKLTIKRFFSHRDSVIPFDSIDSALLIGNIEGDYSRSNGSGKSAIFEALLWVLYNKVRSEVVDDVVMWGESNCEVCFEFYIKDNLYKVTRTRDRNLSKSGVTLELKSGSKWVDKTGSTASLTNKRIVEYVKFDSKTFINSVYFRQNDISEFATSDASRKKEILKSILDLSSWDRYEKDAKKMLKEAKFELAQIEDDCSSYENVVSKVVELKDLAKKIKEEIKIFEKVALQKKTELDAANINYSIMSSKSSSGKLGILERKKASLSSQLRNLNRSLSIAEKNLKRSDSKIVSSKVKLVKTINEKNCLKVIESDSILLNNAEEQLIELKGEHSSVRSKLKELNEYNISSGKCRECTQEVSEDLRKSITEGINLEIESAEEIIKRVTIEAKDVQIVVKQLRESVSNRDKLRSADDTIEYLNDVIDSLSSSKQGVVLEVESLSVEIESCTSELKSVTKSIIALETDNTEELRASINKLSKELAAIRRNIDNKSVNLGITTERFHVNEKEEVRLKGLKNALAPKAENVSALSKMIKYFGKTGIQSILLNSIIDDLEITSNRILNSISGDEYSILLETKRQHSDGISFVETLDLKIRKDDVIQSFKSLSGGEQFRVSLALRIALSEISGRHSGSSVEFLLLDEISSPLDKHGTETLFVDIIKSLEEQYKILVITHDDFLKEKFDKVLKVSKHGGESYVELISR